MTNAITLTAHQILSSQLPLPAVDSKGAELSTQKCCLTPSEAINSDIQDRLRQLKQSF